MRITGDHTVPAPVQEVWDALLDPAVLVRTIPGCSRLEETGQHQYAMTVAAGVAAIKGTYDGSCVLSDLVERESLTMRLSGAGAPGTVDATVAVAFEDLGEAGTRISYDADATVGGMVGGVGQRMLQSVSRRMAAEFFDNVADALADRVETGPDWQLGAPPGAEGSAPAPPAPTVWRHDRKPLIRDTSRSDFLAGVAVGAGLVLLGVVAGSRLGRGR